MRCCDLGVCTACKSSPQSTPRFTITSIHKGHSQNALLSSLTVTLLSPSGALLSPRRIHAPKASDAWADLSDSSATNFLVNNSFYKFIMVRFVWYGTKYVVYMTQLSLIPKHWLYLQCACCRHQANVRLLHLLLRDCRQSHRLRTTHVALTVVGAARLKWWSISAML